MKKTVAITGIGIVSPVGIGKQVYWDSLFQGRTGFRTITLFDTSNFMVHVGGEISDFDPVQFLGKRGLRELDRSTRLVTVAAQLALADGNIEVTGENTDNAGVSIGTTFGSLHSIFEFDRQGLVEGPRYVNPSHFPNTVINSPASRISIRFRIRGFNTTISTGFCASLDALAYACDFISLGRADFVIAGGVEELCEETFLGFHALGCLSGLHGAEPLCCPFDNRRDGTILSEGAAILILEDEEHASRRGADIMASILGYGNCFDYEADRSFNHAGKGLAQAISLALKSADLEAGDIDCIFAGANATKGLDRMESQAIKTVFGPHAYEIPVCAVKSMIGESFSASGSFAVAAAAGSILHGIVPPTVNYRERDPECDLDYVPNDARPMQGRRALVIAADPYGNNSAIIVAKHH
jgi:3-oxoacyl-[acyl-carrier-protein] synthase II